MDGCPKEKNVCALESSLVLIEIYTKSFGGKNFACAIDFLPSKVEYMFFSMPDAVQIRRIFFFLSATLHTQIFLKEIAYILTSYQAPFKSAQFFLTLCW